MKKMLLLSAALGLASAATLTAGQVDVFVTGSTAFRANVYTACTKLFNGSTPTIYYGDTIHGGATSGFSSKTASWVMTGTPITGLTNVYGVGNLPSSTTLVIHGLMTGSIQGIATVENQTPLTFPLPVGAAGGNCTAYTTNTPTIGFSDADGASSPFPATGNYEQEPVCVQPFVMVKAVANNGVTNISNVTWEQMEYGIPAGRIPLSAWTSHDSDSNNWVYLVERTKDSGTRRCFTAGEYYAYGDITTYIFDATNSAGWYLPSVYGTGGLTYGDGTAGVVGPAGLNNANFAWGFGYVGGGDIANTLNLAAAANQSIAYLSIGDSKSVGASNWANVVSYNGIWPTAAGAGIHGNTGTNDFSPITSGYYPNWGNEVLVHPVDTSLISDSKITTAQLGDFTQPGTFMGVFNAQTVINGGSPVAGSIENEIELSKAAGATGIRLSDMKSNRSAVGGVISPF